MAQSVATEYGDDEEEFTTVKAQGFGGAEAAAENLEKIEQQEKKSKNIEAEVSAPKAVSVKAKKPAAAKAKVHHSNSNMDDSELDHAMLEVKTNQEKLEDEMGDFDENYDYDQSMLVDVSANWAYR